MSDMSDYLKTIAIYCGDLIEKGERYRELAPLMERLDVITKEIITGEDISGEKLPGLCAEMESLLGSSAMKLLAIYSRSPDDIGAENLYHRATSIHEMCRNYLDRLEGRDEQK